jgi:hypothetical protein
LERWNEEEKDRKIATEHILVKIEQSFSDIYCELCTQKVKKEQYGDTEPQTKERL